jgi:Ran-binding protein 1
VEKEVVGNWKIVDLPEIAVVTGEEQEEELAKLKSKIYRFRYGEWKERGVGELRYLKHKINNMTRILSRAEKTHRCTLNHFPLKQPPLGILEKLKTGNNTWAWAAQDSSDDAPAIERFCAKFTSKEDFEKFEMLFNDACESNKKVIEENKTKSASSEEEKKE